MQLTAIYGLQPISLVLAIELIRVPVRPKSQSLMEPSMFMTTLDGLMSARVMREVDFLTDTKCSK